MDQRLEAASWGLALSAWTDEGRPRLKEIGEASANARARFRQIESEALEKARRKGACRRN